MDGIVFSENIALLGDHGVGILMMEEPAAAPTTVKPDDQTAVDGAVAKWGDNNDFPQQIIALAEKSTELPALLDWKARALQGVEIRAYQPVYDPVKMEAVDQEIDDPEIREFLTHRVTKRYFREASTDFFWFWNVYPELIKSVSGDKIVYLGTQDASWCRWGKMDPSGRIKLCYVASNWPEAKPEDATTLKLDVIDPYSFNAIEEVRESSTNRWIYPISYPSPGKAYYQLAPWDGYRTSGWAKIATEIPKFKEAVMKFQITIKYLICIPTNYWPAAYPDWNKKSPDQKQEIRKAKVDEINKTLAGAENAGQSLLCDVGIDPTTGKEIPGWKIIPIEDKLKEGAYLEDSGEASRHLRAALALDSALTGEGVGKGMGAGSGSDKRIAFNIYVALQQPYRDVILEPLYFIAEYNGWMQKYPAMKFKCKEIQLETLDKSHQTATEKTV